MESCCLYGSLVNGDGQLVEVGHGVEENEEKIKSLTTCVFILSAHEVIKATFPLSKSHANFPFSQCNPEPYKEWYQRSKTRLGPIKSREV